MTILFVAYGHLSRGSHEALMSSSLKVGGKAGNEVSEAFRWFLKTWKERKSPRESVNRDESQSQGTKGFSSLRRSGKRRHRAESNEMIKN